MGKKNFSVELSQSGIEELKKQLLNYRNVELPNKCKELVERLIKIGVNVSQDKINESPLGKYVTISTDISSSKMGCDGVLLAKGTIKQQEGYAPFSVLLAIEFGAGIHYNPIPNPKASELGFGVGTFPGQIHAFEDYWFYWDENLQEWKPTHGVQATMPMYSADMEIIQNVIKQAKEVFK